MNLVLCTCYSPATEAETLHPNPKPQTAGLKPLHDSKNEHNLNSEKTCELLENPLETAINSQKPKKEFDGALACRRATEGCPGPSPGGWIPKTTSERGVTELRD